jgi:hypothetical protein
MAADVLKDHSSLIVMVKQSRQKNLFDCLPLKMVALHSFRVLASTQPSKIVSHSKQLHL